MGTHLLHSGILAIISFILAGIALAEAVSAKEFARMSPANRAVYDSLDNPLPDANASFQVVGGAEWKTDVGTYQFESGTLTFFQTVMGRPTGCHFEGRGTLTYQPPTAMERGQLFRYCKDSTLIAVFTELFFCFYDSATASELRACSDKVVAEPAVHPGELRAWQKRFEDDLLMWLPPLGWMRLQRDDAPHALLLITGKFHYQPAMYFIVDDDQEEAVNMLRRPNALWLRGDHETVCSYDRRRSPEESANRRRLAFGGVRTDKYVTDVTIKPSVEMLIDVTLTLLPQRDNMRDIQLSMVPDLEISSVWINGDSADYIYDDDATDLFVTSPTPLRAGDTAHVRVQYSGKELLYKFIWGDFYIHYTTRWLPVTDVRRVQTDYETTFRFPKHYDLVSCGRMISDTIDGDWRIKRWETYDPSAYVSFNYGSFDVLTSTVANGPELQVYRSKNHLAGLFGGDMKKAVAADVEGSLQLYAKIFGPYPWPQLAATEIPGDHGQGLPQLLHLAWFSFESNTKGITDHFRAHEVAHQWFGHLVGWTNYHDQWLSEGFAEYAGAMYVQAAHPGNKTFLDLVKQWRSDILDVGGHAAWHDGPHVAPIWLGYRCSSTSSPASYGHLIYSKGAYVLHMLRNMLHDYRTGSDQRFTALMRDYVSSHAHREATTADFQTVVERHTGQNMQWFFDQWVYGVQIPRYEYSWQRRQDDEGKWVIDGKIEQFEVDSTFRVYMPVTLVFDAGRRTFVQEVSGSGAEFTTPPLAEKPKEVIFNDYLTVLCREKLVRKP